MDRFIGGYLEAWRGASPNLRRFILATAVWNAFSSIWWVDFGPYLLAVGLTPAQLGLIAAASSSRASRGGRADVL